MNFQQISEQLADAGESQMLLRRPSGEQVPLHFHETEVGKDTKDFVDCGGVQRCKQTRVLQTRVTNDVDHQLTADKLAQAS